MWWKRTGPNEALHLTGPALRFSETRRSLQPARQVNAVVIGPRPFLLPRRGSGAATSASSSSQLRTRSSRSATLSSASRLLTPSIFERTSALAAVPNCCSP